MLVTTIRRALIVPLGFGMLMAASADFSVVQAQESNTVVIKNFMFSPMALTVKAGSTVTWKNLDGEPHVVVSESACSGPPRLIRTIPTSSSSINRASTRSSAAYIRT